MIEAPAELRERVQWVCWRYELRPDDPKPTKVPYDACTGRRASSTDPSTWHTYLEANAYLETGHADGIGFVLSADDPYVGADLDHCRDPASGTVEQWAKVIVRKLASYTEISPSGAGLRIFVRGELPPHGRHKGNIEVYCQARFLTITGDRYGAAPGVINDRHDELLAWHREVFGERVAAGVNGTHAAGTPSDLDDTELLERARRADNGDRFWGLWNGDWSAAYASHSEADLALANYLAFYCGPDPGRIERLFELSGLMREKWAERADYRAWTIDKALNGRTDYYDPKYRSNGHTADFGVGANVGNTPPSSENYPWQTLDELVHSNPEKPRQLMEHLVWEARTHWLYSGPNAGKTLLQLAVMMHIAAGKEFHGLAVVQGGVLIIEEDSPDSVMADYSMLLQDIYDIDLKQIPLLINKIHGVHVTDIAAAEQIRRWIGMAPFKPMVCVLDACERLVPSETFSSKELHPLSRLLRMNLDDGIANIMIDHTRKPQKGGEKPDPLEMLYGSRAKSAISDVMLYMSGSIKQRAMLMYPKFRGEAPTPIHLSFDGAAGFSIKAQKVQLTENERLVMMVLNNAMGELLTRAELATRTGLGDRTLQRVLGKMVADGLVSRQGDNVTTVYGVGTHSGGLFD